jgi:hypothetical protein
MHLVNDRVLVPAWFELWRQRILQLGRLSLAWDQARVDCRKDGVSSAMQGLTHSSAPVEPSET